MTTKWNPCKHKFEYCTLKIKGDTKQQFFKTLFCIDWQEL